MSPRDPRDDWRTFERGPKQPPPEHGIRMGKAGTTWWGERWIAALARMSPDYGGRLARGKTYARAGRTHDLVIAPGEVTALVTGSRPDPYEVRLELEILADEVWEAAIAGMAAQAKIAAELLAGRMPEEIDAVFAEGGVSLFPLRQRDLSTDCSCPDWANPCKHVAATHYVLGEALDRDPFLLFELRGRSRDEVLAALRAARAGGLDGEPAADPEVPAVSLAKMRRDAYDRAPEPLPSLQLSFAAPAAGLLQQLGAPPGWSSPRSPSELLGPLVRAAAEEARRMAVAEAPALPAGTRAPSWHDAPMAKPAAKKTAAKKKTAKKKTAKKRSAKKRSAKNAKKKTAKSGKKKAEPSGSDAARWGTRTDFGAPVDAFFARQAPALRPITDELRRMVAEAAPDATSSIKWGMPFYSIDGAMMCAIGAHKSHVNLILSGPRDAFSDPDGKLTGEGKTGRHLKLASVEELPRAAVRTWLAAAAAMARGQ